MKLRYRIVLLLLCLTFTCAAQTDPWRGLVTDSATRESLPFVNVINLSGHAVNTSGIDGKFHIGARPGDTLQFSYVGYHSKKLVINNTEPYFLNIILSPSIHELRTIEFVAGENPAFEILRKVVANRKKNDPENLRAFRYKAYHKFYATTEGVFDTAEIKTAGAKFLSKHHLFLNETVSERKVLKPSYDEEIVLGNRMSGVKDPFFAILATNFQPFTFYNDHITILDKNYINPISRGTFERYDFEIVDTVASGLDTTFLIAFEPLKGKAFEGLKGIVYINTNGYAIEHVLAEPSDPKSLIKVKIQQKYILVESTWFPSQLNTEFVLRELQIAKHQVKYVHRSYLTEQQIDPPLTKKEFGPLNLSFAPSANKQNEFFWDSLRQDSLSFKEKNTYSFYDSLPAKQLNTLNSIIKIGEAFVAGKFKYKKFYLPIAHLFRVNGYEDYRFGIGLQTSEEITKKFILEGYAAYGVRDKAVKYGGSFQLNLYKLKDIYLKFSFTQDVYEPGASDFIATPAALSGNESLRNWLTTRMDSVFRIKAELHIRPFPFSAISIFTSKEQRDPTYAYNLKLNDLTSMTDFNIVEFGIKARYAFGETYSQIRNTRIVTGFRYPQIQLKISRANDAAVKSVAFNKIEFKIDQQFLFKGFGKTSLQLHTGWIEGNAPYPYLFNGKGANPGDFTLNNFVIPNHFQTMGIYEFVSDRFINFFINHNFGRMVSTTYRYFRPELSISQHSGFSSLTNTGMHEGVVIKDYKKGFHETGVVVSNILRFKYLDVAYIGIGGGLFYRYGEYSFPAPSDNRVWKLNVSFSF
jgi:hypothetical protein